MDRKHRTEAHASEVREFRVRAAYIFKFKQVI